jgi:transposase
VTAPIQYGPTFSALVIYLAQYQLVPNERLSHLLHDVCGLSMSVGTIQSMITRCAQQLAPFEEALKTALQRSPVIHQDESGLYVQGKRHWVHVCATAQLTHYGVHRKRGQEAIDALGIAPHFTGISVHDGWKSYQGYLCQHALCNVHHLRELTFIEEAFGQVWAGDLKALLLEMKTHTQQARQAGQSEVPSHIRHDLVQRYEALVQQGYELNPPDPPPEQVKRGKRKQHPARLLLDRLHQHQEQVLAFLHHLDVPFDNSLAERDIRMLKVQQKISGCFRAEEGARAFCRIRSYVSTLRKQGMQLLTALELTCAGHPVLPAF